MTQEPPDGTADASGAPGPGEADRPSTPSAELVLPERHLPAAAPRRWSGLTAQLRHRLPELRRHPAAVASASAAATIGSALLVNGLRHALRHAEAVRPLGAGTTATGHIVHEVRGYILHEILHEVQRHVVHEVHVVHHLVHDVRPTSLPKG